MAHFWFLFISAMILAAGGCGIMACLISNLPKKANRIIAIVGVMLILVGLTGMISIDYAVDNASVSNTETSVYTMSKLTTSTVFFEDNGEVKTWSLNDNSYLSIKEATDEYSNVVVKITKDKEVDWLIDFKTQSWEHIVYLDAELYARYKNPDILYEKGN